MGSGASGRQICRGVSGRGVSVVLKSASDSTRLRSAPCVAMLPARAQQQHIGAVLTSCAVPRCCQPSACIPAATLNAAIGKSCQQGGATGVRRALAPASVQCSAHVCMAQVICISTCDTPSSLPPRPTRLPPPRQQPRRGPRCPSHLGGPWQPLALTAQPAQPLQILQPCQRGQTGPAALPGRYCQQCMPHCDAGCGPQKALTAKVHNVLGAQQALHISDAAARTAMGASSLSVWACLGSQDALQLLHGCGPWSCTACNDREHHCHEETACCACALLRGHTHRQMHWLLARKHSASSSTSLPCYHQPECCSRARTPQLACPDFS